MDRDFKRLLPDAQGDSEWVIAANVDIREFSAYTGPRMEAVQAAFFLKTVYLNLIGEHFSDASFVKATGDGLLVIYTHTADDLAEVSKNLVTRCLAAVKSFPSITKGNDMINFDVPSHLGVGIAHGAASRLRTGQ